MPLKRIDTGLARFDYDEKGDHGYLVNLSRQGVKHIRRFADGVFGGKRAALKAARAWRESVIEDHPPLSRGQYVQILRRNNTSGFPGVYATKNSRREITGWEAWWLLPGSDRYAVRKFANSIHGSARAKQMAIDARKAGIAKLADEVAAMGAGAPSAESAARRKARVDAARAERESDWRIARVRVSNVFLSLHFACGAMLQLPIRQWPALARNKPAANKAWTVKNHVVTWPALQLSIDARQFIHTRLTRAA